MAGRRRPTLLGGLARFGQAEPSPAVGERPRGDGAPLHQAKSATALVLGKLGYLEIVFVANGLPPSNNCGLRIFAIGETEIAGERRGRRTAITRYFSPLF